MAEGRRAHLPIVFYGTARLWCSQGVLCGLKPLSTPPTGPRPRYAVEPLRGILFAASIDARSTVRPHPLSVHAHHTTLGPLVTSCLQHTVCAEEAEPRSIWGGVVTPGSPPTQGRGHLSHSCEASSTADSTWSGMAAHDLERAEKPRNRRAYAHYSGGSTGGDQHPYPETARKTRVDPPAEGSQRAAAVHRPRYRHAPGALLPPSARTGKARAGR